MFVFLKCKIASFARLIQMLINTGEGEGNFNSWFSTSLFSVACSATKTICCKNMGKYHCFHTVNTMAAEEENKHIWPVFIHTYFVIMKAIASAEAIGKYYVPMSYRYGNFPWILKHRQTSWNYVINRMHIYGMCTHTHTQFIVILPVKGGVAKWKCAVVHTIVWVLWMCAFVCLLWKKLLLGYYILLLFKSFLKVWF